VLYYCQNIVEIVYIHLRLYHSALLYINWGKNKWDDWWWVAGETNAAEERESNRERGDAVRRYNVNWEFSSAGEDT